MTRAAKQKLARESTAAYAASQPLFDALRIGFVRVGEQKAHLSIARDLVQHLHVMLPDQPSQSEAKRHERYIDCAVRAWRSATDIYADIFESLAKVTAAQASEGREERTGHAEFAEMARTAADARSAAKALVLNEDIAKAAREAEADQSSDDSDESDESDDDEDSIETESDDSGPEVKQESVDTTPTNPILLHLLGKRPLPEGPPQRQSDQPPQKVQRLSEKIKYDSKGRKILWDKGAEKPNVPYGTLGSSEKKAWKAEKRRQKREKKQAQKAARVFEGVSKKNATGANGVTMKPDRRQGGTEDTSRSTFDRDYISLNGAAEPAPMPMPQPALSEARRPAVQYEDVSAEVDARLKAKEEKKAALKTEKKRKRESGNPFGTPVKADDVAERPKKKKARSEDGIGAEGEAVVKEKRKKREADEGAEGEGRKKRRKAAE